MKKRIDWMQVASLGIYLAMMYGFEHYLIPSLVAPAQQLHRHYGLALLCAAGLWVFAYGLVDLNSRETDEFKSGLAPFLKPFSWFGGVAAFGSFAWSVIALASSLRPGPLNDFGKLFMDMGFVVVPYAVFSAFFLWSCRRAAEGTIVVLNDRLLYPGTRFFLFPFMKYKTEIVQGTIHLATQMMNMQFKDGLFNVTVASNAHLDIEGARSIGMSTLDLKALREELNRCVKERLTEWAASKTAGEFLNITNYGCIEKIGEILISWNAQPHLAGAA